MIWLSVNRDFFMDLLGLGYEKIPLLAAANLWGDYQGTAVPLWPKDEFRQSEPHWLRCSVHRAAIVRPCARSGTSMNLKLASANSRAVPSAAHT